MFYRGFGYKAVGRGPRCSAAGVNAKRPRHSRQSQSPYIFFYLAVAVVGAKISFIKSLSIFMKRETLQKRHKQSNKHVFRVCTHSYMYITKVT